MPDRWVRFHSLPHARRLPTTVDQHHEVLYRYNTVLSRLVAESGSAAIYLITVEYGSGDLAAGTEPIYVGLHPGAVAWMPVADPADPELAFQLHASRADFTPGAFDDLLRYVAEDRTTDVVLADGSLRWLFAPYDGGMDVIAASSGERDRLAGLFGSWLSERADGL